MRVNGPRWLRPRNFSSCGGSSVGTLERIHHVAAKIIQTRNQGHDVVVVVSAMQGETDRLIQLATTLTTEPDPREYDVLVATGEQVFDRDELRKMTYGVDEAPGRYVFIDVVDNGHGMNEDTLARMFDPFFSTKETGRGLGMAAVRGIVRSHHAVLRVTTAAGQGTRFLVAFPLIPLVRRL